MGLEVKDNVTFDQCAFKPHREELADYLTSYLAKEPNFVLNVNGAWGTGKTHFVRCWENKISKEHPAIHVDAWKTDFSDDPIISVVETILEYFRRQDVFLNTETEEKILKLAGRIGKTALKVAAGLSAASIGAGYSAGASLVEDSVSILTDAIDKNVKLEFESYKTRLNAIDEFKKEIGIWTELYFESNKVEHKAPVFVFVDELDRCRPTYAVEMLEVIKHFFDMRSYVFVVSTDTNQLSESIKAIYGSGFNSGKYLNRFFDDSCNLDIPSFRSYCTTLFTKEDFNFTNVELFCSGNDFAENTFIFADVCRYYRLKLRDINQVAKKFISILRAIDESMNNKLVNFPLVLSGIIETQYVKELARYRNDSGDLVEGNDNRGGNEGTRSKIDDLVDRTVNTRLKDGGDYLTVNEYINSSYSIQNALEEGRSRVVNYNYQDYERDYEDRIIIGVSQLQARKSVTLVTRHKLFRFINISSSLKGG